MAAQFVRLTNPSKREFVGQYDKEIFRIPAGGSLIPDERNPQRCECIARHLVRMGRRWASNPVELVAEPVEAHFEVRPKREVTCPFPRCGKSFADVEEYLQHVRGHALQERRRPAEPAQTEPGPEA